MNLSPHMYAVNIICYTSICCITFLFGNFTNILCGKDKNELFILSNFLIVAPYSLSLDVSQGPSRDRLSLYPTPSTLPPFTPSPQTNQHDAFSDCQIKFCSQYKFYLDSTPRNFPQQTPTSQTIIKICG